MAPAPIEVEDENEDGLSETQLINEVCPLVISWVWLI